MGSALTNAASVATIVTLVIVIIDRISNSKEKKTSKSGPEAGRGLWSLWTVNTQRVKAAVIGIAIYIVIYAIARHYDDRPFGPIELTSLAQTTALAVGALYGPWAGLMTRGKPRSGRPRPRC